MRFEDILGKEKTKDFLRQKVQEDKIPHAQIFLSREGAGGLAMALAFVSYILCQDRTAEDSCGVCKACTQVDKYIYPDLHFSFPVVKKDGLRREETTSDDFLILWRKALIDNPYMNISDWIEATNGEKTRPNINVKECNKIVSKLSLRSYADGPKILLMWMPEYLGNEGNRLLKLIEEPTPDTYIILVAEDHDSILNTILSRCQLVKILPYKDEQIASHLQNEGIAEDRAAQIARLADGSINAARKLAGGTHKDFGEHLFAWLRICYSGKAVDMHRFSQEMSSLTKDMQLQFFDFGLHFLREYLFWYLTGHKPRLTDSEIATAQKMKSILPAEKIQDLSSAFENGIMQIQRNANMKIAYMAKSIEVGNILKSKVG